MLMDFVKDGQEAIDYLQAKPSVANVTSPPFPTLLILDLNMPRLNGFEVLKWIRQQPGLQRLPVVILSSSGLEQDKQRAYALGADGYAIKPSEPSEMIKLAKCLQEYWTTNNRAGSGHCSTD